jgi:HEAT repeat protein
VDPAEDVDVRIAAIEALHPYDDPTTKRSLAGLLEAGDFSLVWQARYTLIQITGEDHGFDIDAWRRAIG